MTSTRLSTRNLRLPLRRFSTALPRLSFPFTPGPSPPKLPKEEQEEFERLQRASAGVFSSSPGQTQSQSGQEEGLVHPDLRRGAKPEFDGERNPKTGEVGGPKNDPLKYGDWSFNGRVTDF